MNSELYPIVFIFLCGVMFGFVLYGIIFSYTSSSGMPRYRNPPPPPPRNIKVNNMPSVISKESLILSNENHEKAQKIYRKLKNVERPEFPKDRKK